MIENLNTVKPCSVVQYHDIANQNTNPQIVISLPEPLTTPSGLSLGMSDYKLFDTVTFETTYSDLRQHGWTLLAQ